MACRNLSLRSLAAALIAVSLPSCWTEEGEIAVGFENAATPYVQAVSGERSAAPCMTFVQVTEYDDQGREHLIREYRMAPSAGCVTRIDLNGSRFLTRRAGADIRPNNGKRYSVSVVGAGLQVWEILDATTS